MNMQSAFSPRILPANMFAALRTKLGERRLEWQRARSQRQEVDRIMRELDSCTDRQLADLGFCRSEIPSVARASFGRE